MNIKSKLDKFTKIELLTQPTPINRLNQLSAHLNREIYIKRDDLTPLALGGNKLRKLEYLVKEALDNHADTLVTAGAIQSNHVRQTAAIAAMYGLKCVALLENPIGSQEPNFLHNGNRYLTELFGAKCEYCDELNHPKEQLDELAATLKAKGDKPYIIPIGGSNALGSLGYVQCALEIAEFARQTPISAVVVASGSAGTHAGLAVGLNELLPEVELIGVTVSRTVADQAPKVELLQNELAGLLDVDAPSTLHLWDEFFAPTYGMPNPGGNEAIRLLARKEGILLDPVYTGKTMAGLIDGVKRKRFANEGAVLFVHTGGAPGLFGYYPSV